MQGGECEPGVQNTHVPYFFRGRAGLLRHGPQHNHYSLAEVLKQVKAHALKLMPRETLVERTLIYIILTTGRARLFHVHVYVKSAGAPLCNYVPCMPRG